MIHDEWVFSVTNLVFYVDWNNLCFNQFIAIGCVKKLDKIKLMWIYKLIFSRNENKCFRNWEYRSRCIDWSKLLLNHTRVTNVDDNDKNMFLKHSNRLFTWFLLFIKMFPSNWYLLEMQVFSKQRDIVVIKLNGSICFGFLALAKTWRCDNAFYCEVMKKSLRREK